MIQLTEPQWDQLLARLRQDYTPSWTLIRTTMRRELGFTTRQHHHWNGRYYQDLICLDFFDDRQETWFRLRYADMIWDGNSTTT